ncbi:MAG: prephenate dehydrogenase/arogenate dehydrogenase family protein [Anaerolineales bacterium]|nr:prephenate dehydrogenase/arogenate dehydrogenase family protein [Anaerolineales bacterium]
MVNQMEDGFRLQHAKIGIIGLGLMGGSLAKALKGKCESLFGFDTHLPTLELGLATQTVDFASSDFSSLSKVDVLILATPVNIILDIIPSLPSFIKQNCILIDLGSTKKSIVDSMNQLPENFEVIGAHPICGKEKLGLENADANLYQSAPFVITPSKRTTSKAKSAVTQIISAIGANCIEMSAEAHDHALAFTSHLPFLISSALAKTLPKEFSELIGPGFRSTSRLAGTPSHMMMGILDSNRENVLQAIQSFRESLNEIEENLQSKNFSQLEETLNQSQLAYQEIVNK